LTYPLAPCRKFPPWKREAGSRTFWQDFAGASNEEVAIYGERHVVEILKETEASLPVNEVWRKHGISSATYYKWKAK